ncbi:chymotrypsinogen A-like [Panonychus citri]|uniref:chymotrypsinogen A-like n=1 Tax=Panonychus citri TaxID=50023 RepID=UPI0023075542|nr:chymotrypsinogen A-like [Panonychus citri]
MLIVIKFLFSSFLLIVFLSINLSVKLSSSSLTQLVNHSSFVRQSTPLINGQIVGGSRATINHFSYLVSLQKSTPNGFKHYCAGSLIRSNIVLTAAHCVSRIKANNLILVTLSSKSTKSYLLKHFHRVSKIVIHFNYNENGHHNDLALIFLHNHLPLVKLGLTTVRLPYQSINYVYIPSRLTVIGWGVNYGAGYLRKANLNRHDDYECKFHHGNKYRPGMICAGGDGIASCFGDSGGPAILRKGTKSGKDILFGIVSWGSEICGNKPTVFTDIIYYLRWIKLSIAREIR